METIKNLPSWHEGSKIIFSDDKMIVLQAQIIAKNDRLRSISLRDVSREKWTVSRFQNTSAVMVWVKITKKRRLSLFLSKKGSKLTQNTTKKKSWSSICCGLPGTCMEMSNFASNKTEPSHKQQNPLRSGMRKIFQILSPRLRGLPAHRIWIHGILLFEGTCWHNSRITKTELWTNS